MGPTRKLNHFEGAAQVHIQALLLRFAVQRSRAMNQRIGRIHQRAIFLTGQAEFFRGQIPAENAHARVEVFEEFRKIKVQLQGGPQPLARFLFRFRANQQIQLVAMPGEEPRRHVAAQIAGRAGYEGRHGQSDDGAALERAACSAGWPLPFHSRARGSRASSGRPSISG